MRFMATSTYRPRSDMGQFVEARIAPGVIAGVEAVDQMIYDESQLLVPVRSGELKSSGYKRPVESTGKTVAGGVGYSAPHAGFVEFGTGQRGAASPGAGAGPYRSDWAGMAAQPYMRPALDIVRQAIVSVFASSVSLIFRK